MLIYVSLTRVGGTKLQDFKIQEDLNNVDLLLIQTTPKVKLCYALSNIFPYLNLTFLLNNIPTVDSAMKINLKFCFIGITVIYKIK